MRSRSTTAAVVVLLLSMTSLVAVTARAQTSEATCVPACRSGFVCVEGRCVSACNPPCLSTETCTSSGACTASPPAISYATASTSTAAPVTPKPAVSTSAGGDASPPETSATTPSETTGSRPRVHDGFYFRGGLGVGSIVSGSVQPPRDPNEVSVSGVGPAVELAFGGTLPSGFVLGGGIYGVSVPSPSYSQKGVSVDGGSAVISSIGPFVDWYVDPANGFHVQAAIGYAVISAAKGNGTPSFPPNDTSGSGYSLSLGVGYEWWIGEQWSFGLLARVQHVSGSVKASVDTDTTSVTVTVPALLATFTYQ